MEQKETLLYARETLLQAVVIYQFDVAEVGRRGVKVYSFAPNFQHVAVLLTPL
jgi:hypothetical protein